MTSRQNQATRRSLRLRPSTTRIARCSRASVTTLIRGGQPSGDLQPHIEIVFPSRMIFTGILVQGARASTTERSSRVSSSSYSNTRTVVPTGSWDFTQLDIIDVVSRRLLSSCRKADHTSIRKC